MFLHTHLIRRPSKSRRRSRPHQRRPRIPNLTPKSPATNPTRCDAATRRITRILNLEFRHSIIVTRHFTRVGYALHTISILPTTNSELRITASRPSQTPQSFGRKFSRQHRENSSRAVLLSSGDIAGSHSIRLFCHSRDKCNYNFADSALSYIPLKLPPFNLLTVPPSLLKMQFDNIPVSQLIRPVHILPIVDICPPGPCTF